MLFNSFSFLVFFVVVTTLYFLIPHRFRWGLLLLASCLFYMAFIPIYIFILLITILIDYTAGIYIEKTNGTLKRTWLIISILATCMVLFIFKYCNFFISNVVAIARLMHWNYNIGLLSIILPIGLSFHTFQSLSYVIEVYKGNQKAEKNFGIYSLYVMFYPQLVAGPIERPQNLLHQFYEKHDFDYTRVTSGLRLMMWGLFKKAVIADRLAVVVDSVYKNPTQFDSFSLIVATLFFAFQIFCDFSGYSDMAIGAARVMGFKLMTNFNKPYHSRSISEFWKRWHISLSTWFKDYLYIPLGGNRVSKLRLYANLFVVFVVSGFWHGASWTYVIWGALHGFYLFFSLMTRNYRHKIGKLLHLDAASFLPVLTTFCLVSFAWIFFRANNVHDAFYIAKHIFTGLPLAITNALQHHIIFPHMIISPAKIFVYLLLVALLEFLHISDNRLHYSERVLTLPWQARWTLYYVAVMVILFLGVFESRQFIYFQF